MKKTILILVGLFILTGIMVVARTLLTSTPQPPASTSVVVPASNEAKEPAAATKEDRQKVYVAIEGEGVIAVIDAKTTTVTKRIDLSFKNTGGTIRYMPHNVQVAPDGKTVWVTANVENEDMESNDKMMGKKAKATQPDEVIVIDPLTDSIIKRIPLMPELHLSHVAVSKDGQYAIAASQEKGELYMIAANDYTLMRTVSLQKGYQPHGLRISPDGKSAYIAMIKGNAMGILNIASGAMEYVPLGGAVVQTAITPDGTYALATLYDAKKVAIYNTQTKELSYIDLPSDAKGPVQLYPTPDSAFVYVADQGHYFDQPSSNVVYKLDVAKRSIASTILAGKAPHGLVVSPDGQYVYVTNLLDNTVSVISTQTDTVSASISVGEMPNGISMWSQKMGGTP